MCRFIITWLLALSVTAGAQPQREQREPLPFPAGEKLVYEVKISRFPIYATVGEVTFEYLGSQPAPVIPGLSEPLPGAADDALIHLRAGAVSKGLLTGLFNIDIFNRYETLVDARDFAARVSFKEAKESKRHTIETSVFDRAGQAVRYTRAEPDKPAAPPREKLLPRLDGMADVLSAFYFVRLQKLKAGRMLSFPVSNDGENYQFEIVIHKSEQLQTDRGKVKAIKLEPKLFGPGQLFSRPGEMWMWVTDDEGHVPVKMLAKTEDTTITVTLVRQAQKCRRAANLRG